MVSAFVCLFVFFYFYLFTVVLRVFPILFMVCEMRTLPILLSCIARDTYICLLIKSAIRVQSIL
jgi:hypothetical protein